MPRKHNPDMFRAGRPHRPLPPPGAKDRTCLYFNHRGEVCGRSFTAHHAGNRMCPLCKDTKTWRQVL